MSRVRNWTRNVEPGAPPPPPSVRDHSVAPTIYPSSSVSNPDASRYHPRRRAASVSAPPPSSRSHYSSSHYSSSHHSRSRDDYYSSGARRSATVPVPTHMFEVPQGNTPVIARTVKPNGSTGSYVIIPAQGQKVEIISPSEYSGSGSSYGGSRAPSRAATLPSSYSRSSSPTYVSSPTKKTSLFRKVLDNVSWSGKSRSRAGSSSVASGSTVRGRRNSTGSGGSWTVVSGGRAKTVAGGTTITSGGRRYNVVHV